MSYTDADGYQYAIEALFPQVRASSDVSESKPGETEITASIPIDYAIQNKTAGRQAPMPAMHLDYLWSADSAVCQSWDYLRRTVTLAGHAYCHLGIYTNAANVGKIPVGGSFEQKSDPEGDFTLVGAGFRYQWTISEATQAAVLQGLGSPDAVMISGTQRQAPGGTCDFFGTDGTTGSTDYIPFWSSIDLGCGTTVG